MPPRKNTKKGKPRPAAPVAQSTADFHWRTGESKIGVWVWAYAPLLVHFVIVVLLVIVIRQFIADHDFNLLSRIHFGKITPLQSDITTAISSGLTVSRFFVMMWSGATAWRSVFVLLEREGIALEEVHRLLTWQVHHLYPRLRHLWKMSTVVSVMLLAAFPCQLSGPILTGSITWSPSRRFLGGQNVTDIPLIPSDVDWSSFNFSDPNKYLLPLNYSTSFTYARGTPMAAGLASTAWQGSQNDERTAKRIIRAVEQLPINSTLDSVTLPYFAITKLDWIKDPTTQLTQEQLQSIATKSDWNPFNSSYNPPGTFTLVPDNWDGLTPPVSPYTGTISETRLLVGMYGPGLAKPRPSCSRASPFGDMPGGIGIYSVPQTPTSNTPYVGVGENIAINCYVYAWVTYVAGAAQCNNCRISSWLTVQNTSNLTVEVDLTTAYALGMMPMVGSLMVQQNVSLPRTFGNLDKYVTELLIRSYGAAWTFITDEMSGESRFATAAQMAIPTSRANVLWWRVWLWLGLNLLFTLSGLVFMVIQSRCDQRLVGDPHIAAFLLDTTKVLHRKDRAFCNFSTLVKEDKNIGILRFRPRPVNGEHKQVGVEE